MRVYHVLNPQLYDNYYYLYLPISAISSIDVFQVLAGDICKMIDECNVSRLSVCHMEPREES